MCSDKKSALKHILYMNSIHYMKIVITIVYKLSSYII